MVQSRGERDKKNRMRDARGALVSGKLFESVSVNDVNSSIHKRIFLHTLTANYTVQILSMANDGE